MVKEVLIENNRWEEFNSIIDRNDLDIKEKGLLLILFRFVNYKTGYANPSRTLIKKLANITDNRTLDKLINNLIYKGLIKRESGKGSRSKYFIEVGGEITPSVKDVPSVKVTPVVGGKITPTVGGGITPQKENKRKIKEKIYIDLTFIDDVIDKVKITKEQYDKLVNKFNKELVHSQILQLDNYIINGKGKKYKDHYRALNTWCNKNNKNSISKDIYISDEDIEF